MRAPLALILLALLPPQALAWSNGPKINARTDSPAECASPPYATHDWIADHALAMVPDAEKAWLLPHKALYLLGTEAPDNLQIHSSCAGPHRGYGDAGPGHTIEWRNDMSGFVANRDGAARRAREEYVKAANAFENGERGHAAFFLGAMAHYIGDVSQFGHTYPDEVIHSPYESWAAGQTKKSDDGVFEAFLVTKNRVQRTPFTAVKRISKAVFEGKGTILPATTMDTKCRNRERDDAFIASTGGALNLAVNDLADVLHRFFLNEVE
jgi:hypothetical protein